MELGPGAQIGEYLVQETIRTSTTHTVCLARDLRHRRAVAIFVYHDVSSPSPAGTEALVRVSRRGLHRNIAQPIAVGALADGRPYLVLPRIPARTLAERLDEQPPLDVGACCAIGVEVAAALTAAHAAGIVHGCLRPSSILLSSRGAAAPIRVVGFGLAPWFKQPADPSADVRALGAILHRALTSLDPWAGPTSWFDELSRARVPTSLAEIVQRCLWSGPTSPFNAAAVHCALVRVHGIHTQPTRVLARRAARSLPPPSRMLPTRRLRTIGRGELLAYGAIAISFLLLLFALVLCAAVVLPQPAWPR